MDQPEATPIADTVFAVVDLETTGFNPQKDRIVQMAAPFAVFPADIRRDYDQLVITRTWFFAQGDKIWTE